MGSLCLWTLAGTLAWGGSGMPCLTRNEVVRGCDGRPSPNFCCCREDHIYHFRVHLLNKENGDRRNAAARLRVAETTPTRQQDLLATFCVVAASRPGIV